MATDQKSSERTFWKIIRNKFGYTDEEIGELKKTKWGSDIGRRRYKKFWSDCK